MIRRSAAAGYGISRGHAVAGIGALGLAIVDPRNNPMHSVAIVGTLDQFTTPTLPRVEAAVRSAIVAIDAKVRARTDK